MRNQRRSGQHIRHWGDVVRFQDGTRDMLKLRSIGIRDYSVFEGGSASAGSASPASACRASGFGTSLLSLELIWKEYGDVVMTLAVSDHRKPP